MENSIANGMMRDHYFFNMKDMLLTGWIASFIFGAPVLGAILFIWWILTDDN